MAGLDPCQPSAFSSYFIHQYAICMHEQSNYIGSKPRFSNNSGLVNEDRSFFTRFLIYSSFLLQFLLPQTNHKSQTKKLTTFSLLLLLLYVGLSLWLLSFVVVYVSVCNNFQKTIDVTSIYLYPVHCKQY